MSPIFKFARAMVCTPSLVRQLTQTSKTPTVTHKLLVQHRAHLSGQQAGYEGLASQRAYPRARVQEPAPDFKGMAVINGQFKEVSLKDYAGKYLVLFFYPLDFTFVCPTEVIAFNDRASEFNQLNAELVAVSVDSHFSHLAWVNTPRKNGGLGNETKIPVLSDIKKQIALDYGCLSKNSDIALRALYIIDTKGIIRQITINDLPVGRSVDEVLRLIKAFQFADEHGEVCPANWQPNAKTINPTKANEYFSSEFSN